MTARIEKLGADRLRVLKALLAGGRVEKRRVYPFPETYHLVRPEARDAPPKVSELVMLDLVTRGLIQPTRQPDLNDLKDADTLDYVATPAGQRAAQLKGIVYDDPQDTLFGEEVGKHAPHEMEAA